MNKKRKTRLMLIIFFVSGISLAWGLVLYALRENVNLYYTPSEAFHAVNLNNRIIRLGGLIKQGSVHYKHDSLNVSFTVTDLKHEIIVHYQGVLPALFREGQGIVADGHLDRQGEFIATQVLAKHDANYHPPSIGTR